MAEPKIADLLTSGESLLVQAYRRGVRDGIALAREKAMRALSEPIDEGELPESPPEVAAATTGDAVPRGTVRPIVRRVLADQPGRTIAETQRLVARIDNRISPLSVSNELHRNKGKLYHQRLRRWYVKKDGEKETAGEAHQATPAASTLSSQGELHVAPLAAPPSG